MIDLMSFRTSMLNADEYGRRALLAHLPSTDDVGTLLEAANYLSDPSPSVCEAAAEALIRCANRTAAIVASVHLYSDSPSEREYTLSVLSSLGENTLPVLKTLLTDADPAIRKFACVAMLDMPCKGTAKLLCSALLDEEPLVACTAAEALGHLKHPHTTQALIQALRSSSSQVRSAVLMALGNIGDSSAVEAIISVAPQLGRDELCIAIQAMGTACGTTPELAWPFFIEHYGSENITIQNTVLFAVNELVAKDVCLPEGFKQFVSKTVEKKIFDLDAGVRLAAANVLKESQGAEAIRYLRLMEHDPDPDVQNVVMCGLIHNGVYSPMELLVTAHKTQNSASARLCALRTLVQTIDETTALPVGFLPELECVINETKDEPLKATALSVLLCVSPDQGIPLILSAFKAANRIQSEALIQEIMGCPPDKLTRLTLEGYGNLRLRLRLLQLFQSKKDITFLGSTIEGQTLLIAGMGDDDVRVRACTITILNRIAAAWAQNLVQRTNT